MSFCSSRSFLALLLGAGVSGAFAASALAGDKIEFSPVSETLAMPKVDRPDSEPDDALSGFSFGQPVPQGGFLYVRAPSRRGALPPQ